MIVLENGPFLDMCLKRTSVSITGLALLSWTKGLIFIFLHNLITYSSKNKTDEIIIAEADFKMVEFLSPPYLSLYSI